MAVRFNFFFAAALGLLVAVTPQLAFGNTLTVLTYTGNNFTKIIDDMREESFGTNVVPGQYDTPVEGNRVDHLDVPAGSVLPGECDAIRNCVQRWPPNH